MVSLNMPENNNGTVEIYVADRFLNLKNGTLIYLKTQEKFQDNDINELLYVVVVIMFYATTLMVLIATQIKRAKREGQEVDYYDEYLQRNSALYQKKKMQQQMMQRVQETTGFHSPTPNLTPTHTAAAANILTPGSTFGVPCPTVTINPLTKSNSVQLEKILDEEV